MEKKWPTWEKFQQMWGEGKAFLNCDGCTNSPDLDFVDCCYEHDYYYTTHAVSRAEADKRLRQCIAKKGWHLLPWVYWAFTRAFGRKAWKKKFDPEVEVPREILWIDEEEREEKA